MKMYGHVFYNAWKVLEREQTGFVGSEEGYKGSK